MHENMPRHLLFIELIINSNSVSILAILVPNQMRDFKVLNIFESLKIGKKNKRRNTKQSMLKTGPD